MEVEEDSEWYRAYRVRKTVVEMLAARGYLLTATEKNLTPQSFKERFGENPTEESLFILVPRKNEMSSKIFVFFPSQPKVGVKEVRGVFDRMKDEGTTRAIVVIKQGITSFARQALLNMSSAHGYTVEQFLEKELLINVIEHRLVPAHIVLTREEKKKLLDRYKLQESQLPRIQQADAVARFYGLSRGEVVKIIRPSETAGRYVTYRLVV